MAIRMPNLNKVHIAGNLVDDPRMGLLESGVSVANFRIASSQSYKTRDGEWKEKTCFVDVVAWRRTAELVGQYLRKGSPVLIEGELQTSSWQAQDGTQRSRVEILSRRIQFLEKRATEKFTEEESVEKPDQNTEPVSDSEYEDIPF